MKIRIVIGFVFALLTWSVEAQVDRTGMPISAGLLDINYNTYDLPSIPINDFLLQEYQDNQFKAIPYRFAHNFFVSINPNNPVTPSNPWTWIPLSNGNGMWLISIQCPNAIGLGLTFDEFRLDKGAHMIIYNEDLSEVIGTLTDVDNNQADKFGTVPLTGDRIFLEIFLPANKTADVEISSVACKYREYGEFTSAEDCALDAKCVLDGSADDQMSSVVRILSSNGTRANSGVLINSNSNSSRPYVITSAHGMNGDPATWSFVFNYKSNFCGSEDVSSHSLMACGAEILKESEDGELLLLRLFDTPTLNWNTHYNGWNRAPELPAKAFSVHHPFAGKSAYAITEDIEVSELNGREVWKVFDWNEGLMNPGSAGAPLFDEQGLIIGFFIGGDKWCGEGINDKGDYFIPLHNVWGEFKSYLDPQNISPFALIGRDGKQEVKSQRIFNDKVAVFPTPADDFVFLINENEEAVQGIRILDAQGRLLEYQPFNQEDQRIDISHLPSGWYLFQVELETFATTHKVVVR